MTEDILKRLPPESRLVLTSQTIVEGIPGDLAARAEPFGGGRAIDLEPLDQVIRTAMATGLDRAMSDAWLAPRVHATLRLYRREAADPGIWLFLSSRFPEYIRWRWQDSKGVISAERIVGGSDRHALARLWWAAELSRNGDDYTPTVELFRNQSLVNWVLETQAFRNRPTAIAFIRYMGHSIGEERVKATAKALRHALTTVALDALAPDEGTDPDVMDEWVESLPDYTLMLGQTLPEGPSNAKPVPEALIADVMSLLRRIAPNGDADDGPVARAA